MVVGSRGVIKKHGCVTAEAISDLVEGKVLAVHIPNYYDQDKAEVLAHWIYNHPVRSKYTHDVHHPDGTVEYLYYHVDRVGYPRNLLVGKTPADPEWNMYFQMRDEVVKAIHTVTGADHPIERLMDDIALQWPLGAELEQLDGVPLFAGIGRITCAEKSTRLGETPHVDGCWTYQAHLGANVYLQAPPQGGELEVFHVPVLSYEEIIQADHNYNWEAYPSTLIKPEAGDLILINTRRAHAVKNFTSGRRVSIASFIGFNPHQPFRFYS